MRAQESGVVCEMIHTKFKYTKENMSCSQWQQSEYENICIGQCLYVLNIRSNLSSVTMRVRHNGHSLELAIIRSEHSLHIAICLQRRQVKYQHIHAKDDEQENIPAVNDSDICLFILTDDT